ncbi:hypothetical protein BLA50215_07781 [Burkholderia lata]|uniref:hypothetical protein n=1 Tax=Burkholderia lata (strain ATCC 17760 / DSM 23089 / LMG 22485 / NCIMB 9086 / R18194 / 383) TaxID=482957 RepID=UPI0014546622|nr:hypothetical protein [Burkholderia lata]VWD63968.1 hypothetical protein BLA50215_07781 [Burkholderia lata]
MVPRPIAVSRRKDLQVLDVDRVASIIAHLVGQTRPNDAAAVVDTATALREIGQSVGCMPCLTRVVQGPTTRIVWHGTALSQLKRQLTRDPFHFDAVWTLRQLEAVLVLIACWPALYPPGSMVGSRRADFVVGGRVDYRCVGDRIEIFAVTVHQGGESDQ